MKNIILILIIISVFINNLFSKDTYDFAVNLYNEGDYYRAITEFNRYLFYNPKSLKKDSTLFYIAKSYYYAEQYNQAITELPSLKNKASSKKTEIKLDLILVKSYLYLEKFSFAEKILNNYKYQKNESLQALKHEYDYTVIWLNIFQHNWDESFDKINRFISDYPESPLRDEALLLRDDVKEGIGFSTLSPTLAGVLSSIIPGTGQMYCKRWGDGFTALGFISLLTYGVYYYNKNGPDGMMYGFAVLDVIFYLGNIYSAIGSAHKYNRNFNQELKNSAINSYNF